MEQKELIPEISRLCSVGEYDKAIGLTEEILVEHIAVDARLLCIEHEEWRRRAASIRPATTATTENTP